MVRIKHRYLLLNILYPSPKPPSSAPTKSSSTSTTPSYLPFLSPSPSTLTSQTLIRHLRASIAANFGDYGHGVTAPHLKVVYLSNATSTAIVRCPRAHFRLVWASLTFMDALPAAEGRRGDRPEAGKKCVIRVVRVSGTIKKAEEEVVRRAKREIVRAKTMMGEGGGLEALMGDGKASGSLSAKGAPGRGDGESRIEDHDEEDEDMDDDSD